MLQCIRDHANPTVANRKRVGWAGFYYVVAPKTFQLEEYNTKEPFLELPVNGLWIWNIAEGEKISIESARSEVVKWSYCLRGHTEALDKLSAERQRLDLAARIEANERIVLSSGRVSNQSQVCKHCWMI